MIDVARGLVIPAFGRPAASLAAPARAGDGAAAAYYLRFLRRRRAGGAGAGGGGARRRRDLDQPDAPGRARDRRGADPDRDPPHRAGGARPRRWRDRRARRSAGRRRWRSASRRSDAPREVRPARDGGHARRSRRSTPTTCCTASPPSRRCRPTPPRWRARRADVLGRGLPYLVAEAEGRLLGYAYAAPYRLRSAYRFAVEDSIYLDPAATGRGIGGPLLAALIEASTAAGARQMLAVIGDSGNAASIAVHARAGFAPRRHLPRGRLQVRPLGRHGDDAAPARPGRRHPALSRRPIHDPGEHRGPARPVNP